MILLRLTSFNIFSFELLRYFSRLCTSTCTQSTSPIRPLPPSHLCKYSLSTSALGCYVPYIVISFLVFRSRSSSSIFIQLMIPAPYLTMETALELMAKIIFPPFNFDFSIFLTFLMYSLFDFSSLHALYHRPLRFQDTCIHLPQYSSSSFYRAYLFLHF